MIVVYGITDLQNPAENHPTKLFIDSQGFTGIGNLFMLRIKEVPHMIKYQNLVPNQEVSLGAIQHRKLPALVLWEKDRQRNGLSIIAAVWPTVELTSSITQINNESPPG